MLKKLTCMLMLGMSVTTVGQAKEISYCGLNEHGVAQFCDVAFTSIPTFAPTMTSFQVQRGTYRIHNNTNARISLKNIRLVKRPADTLPATATRIDATIPNACGASLAPHASCNIGVVLDPNVQGTFSRFLKLGIDTRQCSLESPIFSVVVTAIVEPPANINPPPAPGEEPPPFYNCLINAKASLSNKGETLVNGGACSKANLNGFPPGVALELHDGDAFAKADIDNAEKINTRLRDLCEGKTFEKLTSTTLTPGTYCVKGNLDISSLVLSGNGDPSATFFIIVEGKLTTEDNSTITLVDGAQATNVFFSSDGKTTLGNNSEFRGNLFTSKAHLDIGKGVVVFGAIKSLGANATIDQLTISAP